MDAMILVQWKLVVSTTEFRLIQKALRGALDEDEKVAALVLQAALMRTRAKQAAQLANEAQKAVDNIDKSED